MRLRIRDVTNSTWTAESSAANFEDARTRVLLDGVVTVENNEFIPPQAIVGVTVLPTPVRDRPPYEDGNL